MLKLVLMGKGATSRLSLIQCKGGRMDDQCDRDAIDTAYREGFASGQYGLIDANPYDPYDPNEANLVATYERGFADAIANQWECNCVLPEQSCPACRAVAREVYEEEDDGLV